MTEQSFTLLFCCLLLFLTTSKCANSLGFYIADFNNDGKDDYLALRRGDWATDVLDANAQLTLALEVDQYTSVFHSSVVLKHDFGLRTDYINVFVGDFNGDGLPDILRQETDYWATDEVNTAYLMINDGFGSFTKYILSEEFNIRGNLVELYIGDFNGDGKQDIFRQEKGDKSSHEPSPSNILLAVDDIFTSFQAVDVSPPIDLSEIPDLLTQSRRAVLVEDFNGDGYSDILRLVSQNNESFTGTLFISKGDGSSFEEKDLSEYTFGDGADFYTGDFNGDRKKDFVQCGGHRKAATLLFLSDGNGGFQTITLPKDIKCTSGHVLVGDFNGDGKSDMFSEVYNPNSGPSNLLPSTFYVYLSTGDNFEAIETFSPEGSMLSVGDFDGDKQTDILEYDGEPGKVTINFSNGDGTFFPFVQ